MPNYVSQGAKLKCSMGDSQSELHIIHPNNPVYLHGKLAAGIMDHKPFINIRPFGKCQSMVNPVVAAATAANNYVLRPMPCMPMTTSPWVKGKENMLIKGHPALLDDCLLACAYAGIIEIVDDGQDTTGADGETISKTGTGAKGIEIVKPEPKITWIYWMDEEEKRRLYKIEAGQTAIFIARTRGYDPGESLSFNLKDPDTSETFTLNGTVGERGIVKIKWTNEEKQS